jgi:hypothetical protein
MSAKIVALCSLLGGFVVGAAGAAWSAEPVTSGAEAPKADAPSADAPKADAAKADAPKAEAPKAEAKSVEKLPAHEENCGDGIDNDGDGLIDCADSDCKDAPECKAKRDGKPENTPERCSDWVDNDGDGLIDCDDSECQKFAVCQGSWKGPVDGDGEHTAAAEGGSAPTAAKHAPGVEAADSNDGVGFVGVRFGVVAGVVQEMSYDNAINAKQYVPQLDTRINLLQLRAFGQLPLMEDSFFLINIRGDVSPRLTFAEFQMPLGGGNYLNINTGGGSLSNELIVSAAKLPLLEPAFWMTSAFEQGNSAAVEVSGPIVNGILRYRGFVGGGAGFATGNVGNRHFTLQNLNYTYTAGAQLQASPVGHYDRFDSRFLYKEVPLALGVVVGAKYDQREQERYPAVNALAALRWGRFELSAEDYSKAELNFGALQNSYDITLGALVIPEWLFFAVDGGQFYTSDFGELTKLTGIAVAAPPKALVGSLRGERAETDLRAALHFFFWRDNGVLSARYTLQLQDPDLASTPGRKDPIATHTGWIETEFRF